MKVYIETLGCPKNFNDTEVAKGSLCGENDFTLAASPEDADIIMVNTCGFINDAKKESIDKIFEMSAYKHAGKKLVVSGCLSERYSKELFDEMPEVDCFIGVNEYEQLPEIFRNLDMRKNLVGGCIGDTLPRMQRKLDDNPFTSTLKISEGCDNFCAYCVIPSIRGGFRSKRMEDVLAEAEELAAAGCKELILIAQDVTNYGIDLYGAYKLPELLRQLCRIEGIVWIRLMYCYEDRITDELIAVMATEPKICHYIDIPIQHAADTVLTAMNRRSTGASIRTTIRKLREAIPDMHIRTTLIVGFPGETEDDFEVLLDFVETMRFERLGVFAYSREEGTPAGEMENQIDEAVKEARLDAIMRRQLEISLAVNEAKIGKTFMVLVEERDADGSYIGRTAYDAPEIDDSVLFTSKRALKAGDFVQVQINDAFDYDLIGVEVEADEFTK